MSSEIRFPQAECVIVDFDGTLVDTCRQVIEAKLETLRQMRISRCDEDIVAGTIGMQLREGFVLTTGISEQKIWEEAFKLYNDVLFGMSMKGIRPVAGAVETIGRLRDGGMKVALMSARLRGHLDAILAKLGWGGLFDMTVAADDVRPKPWPDLVYKVMDDLGFDAPEQVVVVGDTTLDIETAHGAGAPGVAVDCGSQTRRILEAFRPEVIIESIDRLPNLLPLK